ncbi:MAG TPA: AI-2E family transporter [Chloroflexia bacterium]|nr:AI-2E family transporter [Chloroflexia bacterium]
MSSETTSAEPDASVQEEVAQEEASVPVLNVNHLRLSTVVLVTAGVLAVLVLAYLLYQTLALLLILFLALLIATAIEPLVNFLRRGPFNRSAGILVVYTGIFLVLGIIGYLTLPVIFEQAGELGGSLSKTAKDMRTSIEGIDSPFVRQQATVFVNALDAVGSQFAKPAPTPASGEEGAKEAVETVRATTITIAEIFFAIVTIFVVAFYWLTERTLVKRAIMSWFPARRANRIRRVWDDIEVKVGGWVRGQITLMAIVGAISAVGYFFIGLQYWPALALFIAVAEAIPLVGPYIGTAPAILVALTQPGGGLGTVLAVVIFAVLLQTVEGNVLVPRVMKDSVGISPLVVIVSILFGSVIAGLAGALVAVPLAGSLQVIVQDIKAARESQEKFEEQTEGAREVRAQEGELVVAHAEGRETKTQVERGANA